MWHGTAGVAKNEWCSIDADVICGVVLVGE